LIHVCFPRGVAHPLHCVAVADWFTTLNSVEDEMGSLNIEPLRQGLPFGVRIDGVTRELLKDQAIRRQINDVFEQAGVIVFENVDGGTGDKVLEMAY
jgi:hypothetical protein